jgi:hypothetical protein
MHPSEVSMVAVRQGSVGASKIVSRMARAAMAAGLATAASAGPALAQRDADPLRSPSMRLESTLVAVPLADLPVGNGTPVRVDITLLPDRPSALGLAAGITSLPMPLGGGQATVASPSLDLGVHWRQQLANNQRIDITAWRRMTQPTDAISMIEQRQTASYGARVEMKLSGSGKGFVADKGFIGLQMEGGGRLMLRKKDGKPTLYYRVKF